MSFQVGWIDIRMSKKKKNYHRKYKKRNKMAALKKWLAWLLVICLLLVGADYYFAGNLNRTEAALKTIAKYSGEIKNLPGAVQDLAQQTGELLDYIFEGQSENVASLEIIPEYNGETYVTVNGNIPSFSEEEKNSGPYEYYSDLDSLGRCGYAEAKIDQSLMPTQARDAIGSVKPSGWHTIKYDVVDGKYLYNRCHLIGYQLTAENANEKNLITGTRYLNVEGMLPWENKVADYIQETGDSVMYRVTPIFEGSNLLASGVQMEAESLGSDEISFNIYVFNVQPGVGIDYLDGNSWLAE